MPFHGIEAFGAMFVAMDFSYWTRQMVASGKKGGQTDSQCMKVSTSGEIP